jgi:hypothetical protein
VGYGYVSCTSNKKLRIEKIENRMNYRYVMDDLGDPFGPLAAGLYGWGRKQHPSAAGDSAGCFGTSANNQAADTRFMTKSNYRGHGVHREGQNPSNSPCSRVPRGQIIGFVIEVWRRARPARKDRGSMPGMTSRNGARFDHH